MSDFAKIIRATDGQIVLFLKEQSDEGKPALYRMTEHEGVTAKLGIQFDDDEAGDQACQKAYDACDVETADAFRKRIVELLS
jgi:hypothetical protein